MKFETYLLLGIVLFGVWKTQRSVQRSQTAQERYFTMRASIFSWFVGFLVLAGLLFLPFRVVALLLVPVAFGGLTVAKYLRDARERLRRENEERVDIDRMKRVN
ncbi:MAG: hypothetical protein ABJF10_27660 [Chthoniobacter sp.]|uniref:hypothetical protein n=1 Tax=Chthoniobacter sp. TaxID=2510640 RepID=UPI0032A793B7